MEENNAVKDKGQDRKFFVIVPQVVQAKCSSVYDFALWVAIRSIAGDEGECYASTRTLAALAHMSVGQVVTSRRSLIDAGLLVGNQRPHPIHGSQWFLSIPSTIWDDNYQFATQNPSMAERVRFSNEHSSSAIADDSEGCSPHEQGCSPHEQGCSPREPNKINLIKPINNTCASAEEKSEQYKKRIHEALVRSEQRRETKGLEKIPEDIRPLAEVWVELFGRSYTSKTEYAFWVKSLREFITVGMGADDLSQAYQAMRRDNLTVKSPASCFAVAWDRRQKLREKSQTIHPSALSAAHYKISGVGS